MNLFEKLSKIDDSNTLLNESNERLYCIVAKTNDGKTKFYKDGAFIDDYKSCTTFNDLDDARSEWFDVDKTKYKRVFVPVYDPEAFAKLMTECSEACNEAYVSRQQKEAAIKKIKNYNLRKFTDAQIDAMYKKLVLDTSKSKETPDEQSAIEHPTCDNCGMRLNDGGTCPRCDDGEEDLNESIDNILQKDAEKILKHTCDKPELLLKYPTFEDYLDELSIAGVFTIPESVPSVGFKVVDAENISETEAAEYIKILLDKTWLRERLNELADSLFHNNGFRYDMLKDEFKVGDRVAHRYADEYNVGTIKDTREHEGIQYQVEWDYSEGEPVEWLYADELTHWVDVNEAVESNVCCICKKPFTGYGNNAAPVCDGTCCDKCNTDVVIPARISHLNESTESKEYISTSTNPEMAAEIAQIAQRALRLNDYEAETLEHDINNLRAHEWVDAFLELPETSSARRLFFAHAVVEEDSDDMLTESNKATVYLPDSIDMMLMDMAQMYGEFDYTDIHNFASELVDEEDLRKLKNIYRRWRRAAEIEDDMKMEILAKETSDIIKKPLTEDAHNLSGLSDEVEEIIYEAVQEAFEVGHADEDMWKTVKEDLDNAGLEYDETAAKKYFSELLVAGLEYDYDDEMDW